MQHAVARRRLAAVVAVVAILVLAAACRGRDDGQGPEDPDEPEATATAAAAPSPTGEPTGRNAPDGILELGYILPETGPLSLLGPPQISAIDLALAEINGAGGVLGNDVTISAGDEAGDPTVASQTAERLLGEGVDAIIGAAASSMSLAFVDAVTNAGVAQCSASNTSPTFTDYSDNGLYFRTAPSDVIHGRVLAQTITGDGHRRVAILARADDYGQGLLNATRTVLERREASVVAEIIYDPEAASFESEVRQVAASDADAVVLISFEEGVEILRELIASDLGPGQVALYGADGLRSNELAGLVDPNDPSVLRGMKGTAPGGEASEAFLERFREASGLTDTTFAAQAYDCTILLALAAIAAGSDGGTELAAHLVDVSRGGTKCLSFRECKGLLEDGQDIDYDGASGSVDLVDAGEPDVGAYEIWRIDAEGRVQSDATLESELG